MPKFLSRAEIYRLLQRELPDDVYPDGAPSAFFSTADMDSVADVVATGYSVLERIYDNYFPQTTVEKVDDWEIKVFGVLSASGVSLTDRRTKLLNRLRLLPGITKAAVSGAVASEYPSMDFQIIEWGNSEGGWVLDESALDFETFLNGANLVDAVGPLLCEDSPSKYGKTQEEWLQMREDAYTYELRIYNETLTLQKRTDLDKLLSAKEPARSGHVITDGLTDADKI